MQSKPMSRLGALLLFLSSGLMVPEAQAVDCSSADITLQTQAHVDQFQTDHGPCDTVIGLLRINTGAGVADPIVNLNGLSALIAVGGRLEILNNSGLTDLTGLNALASVGDNLEISSNGALVNLDALSGLTSVGAGLVVSGSTMLTNLNGLSALSSATSVTISGSDALTNLSGLSAITGVGGLHITGNGSLADLSGLPLLSSLSDDLVITDNALLTDISALSALTSVGDTVRVGQNASLSNLDGLSALTTVGGLLNITQNPALSQLDGLSTLNSVGGNLDIAVNNALANVDGLSALTTIGGRVFLLQNPALSNLNGFAALTSVGTDLRVQANTALTNCAALAPVLGWPTIPHNPGTDSVGGTVAIAANAVGAQSADDCLSAYVVLALSTNALDFGDIEVGITSPTQSVTLSNTGFSDVDISAIDAAAAPFTLSGGTCASAPFTLAPSASCTLEYSFSPTAVGAASQTINISSTLPSGPVSVNLQGTGVSYTLGGLLSGLVPGDTVVLQVNGGDDLTLSANGAFTFATPVLAGTAYAVTVLTQPAAPSESCNVKKGSGTMPPASLNDVSVVCALNEFTVGGTVSGLTGGETLVLQINGADDQTLTADGNFTFSSLADGSSYTVTVATQPASQSCSVSNGSGTLAGADVTNVSVTCVSTAVAPARPVPFWSLPALVLTVLSLMMVAFYNLRIRGLRH